MIEKDSDESSTCFSYTPTEDWGLDMEGRCNGFEQVYEHYSMCIHAGTLTNWLSLKTKLQPLTSTRRIYIDMSRDSKYVFDQHFFDIRFWDWEHYENTCNITLDKQNYLDQTCQGYTEGVIKCGLHSMVHGRY